MSSVEYEVLIIPCVTCTRCMLFSVWDLQLFFSSRTLPTLVRTPLGLGHDSVNRTHSPLSHSGPPMAAPVGGMGLGPRFNPLEVKLKPTPHPHPHPPAKEKEQPKKPELKKAPPRAAPSKPPALPPQEADVERAKVVFAYTSEQEDELTIQVSQGGREGGR